MRRHEAWPAREVQTQLLPIVQTPFDFPANPSIGGHIESRRLGAPLPRGAAGGAVGGGSGMVPFRQRMLAMVKTKAKSPGRKSAEKPARTPAHATPRAAGDQIHVGAKAPERAVGDPPKPVSKQHQLAALLVRDEGATLDQMVAATGWLPHTTRAALTGLKKKGYALSSDKVDGVRTYRAVSPQ